jgi:hypothetical protein
MALSLDFRLAIEGNLGADIAADQARIARGYTRGIRKSVEGLKLALRRQVVEAGLGERLGNSIRGVVYPERGDSMSAAGSVFARKSSHIFLGHHGALIRATGNRTYLAIPTKNVPPRRRGGDFGSKGSKANPFEVETRFNQDLIFVPGRNGTILAFIDAIRAKNKRGWRVASKGRVRQGRKVERILMFLLVPQVRLRRRLDFEAAWRAAVTSLDVTVAREVDAELAAP